nr:uncharacterized protein LOC104266168 [Ciona intestinalis]|eukprot:XP_009860064.1 uncharacterized protein LOC104266168 [Ciona intestinalis]
MLLYIQSKAYPGRTFVDLCRPSDTVARVRANLLHSLHEIGHSNHQFRLQYKGSYLRDAYTLEEYKILNNAVISMIPLNDVSEWNKDLRFHQSTTTTTTTDDQVVDVVQSALCEEIGYLDTREKVLRNYKTLVMMQIVLAFLALFTVYWYFFFAYLFVIFASFIYSPSFTRIGGWMGKNSVRRREFMVVMILLCTLMVASSILLLVFSVSELTLSPYPTTRCQSQVSNCFSEARGDPVEEGVCTAYQMRCYESSVWTSVYFCIVIIFMISTGILCCYLLYNFKFEVGDFIEHYLIQTREMQQVMHAAKHGDTSQKRSAVFELATMAASADDNKFQIVTEGGLDILISLALSKDSTTQEYAAEAIAECLTVPAIQDQFVATGGM